jgi:hypothetical protein
MRGFLQAEPFVHGRARAYRRIDPIKLVLADWCVPVHTSARRCTSCPSDQDVRLR